MRFTCHIYKSTPSRVERSYRADGVRNSLFRNIFSDASISTTAMHFHQSHFIHASSRVKISTHKMVGFGTIVSEQNCGKQYIETGFEHRACKERHTYKIGLETVYSSTSCGNRAWYRITHKSEGFGTDFSEQFALAQRSPWIKTFAKFSCFVHINRNIKEGLSPLA